MVEEGYQVRIEWIDFEMENAWSGTKCKFDYAALVDAAGQVIFLWQTFFPSNDDRCFAAASWQHWVDLLWERLATQCGQRVKQVKPSRKTNSGIRITVEIKTDGSENFRGFKLRWTRIHSKPTYNILSQI